MPPFGRRIVCRPAARAWQTVCHSFKAIWSWSDNGTMSPRTTDNDSAQRAKLKNKKYSRDCDGGRRFFFLRCAFHARGAQRVQGIGRRILFLGPAFGRKTSSLKAPGQKRDL